VWAWDEDEAEQVRAILVAAHCSVCPATGRKAEPRVLDLDIGVTALEGLRALEAAGYAFRWHTSQHVLNRESTLAGIPVADALLPVADD